MALNPTHIYTTGFHPKNVTAPPYNISGLQSKHADLTQYVVENSEGLPTIDFKNQEAVYHLNKALLIYHCNIRHWDVPQDYLIPGVPIRAEYIHRMADFIESQGVEGKIKVLDIGTGANLVYPIIGVKNKGWKFIATDTDASSLQIAQAIARFNGLEPKHVTLVWQTDDAAYFEQVIDHNDAITFTMCNPPFHASAAEAMGQSDRKQVNLDYEDKSLNFGGRPSELWVPGGELRFIEKMIEESQEFSNQVQYFSSLVSKKDNLKPLLRKLNGLGATAAWIIHMDHGNKKSRVLIWKWAEDISSPSEE